MQSYPFTLKNTNNGQAIQLSARGTLFVYESGAGAADGTETRVWVKPDSGGEILLRPGQRFRPPSAAQQWNIRLYGTDQIDGYFIIGEGDFDDANTKNSVKLDASFANNVTVLNDTAHRVPVALDPNALLNVAGNIVTYTNKYATAIFAMSAGVAYQVVPPSQNVNGIILNKALFMFSNGSGGGAVALLARSAAPSGSTADPTADQILMDWIVSAAICRMEMDIGKHGQIKIPPGKGLYVMTDLGATNCILSDLLYTVL